MLFIIISTVVLTILSLLSLNWFNLDTGSDDDDDDVGWQQILFLISLTRIIPILLIISIYYNYNNKNKYYILYSLIAGYILYSLIPFLSCPNVMNSGASVIHIPNIIALFDKNKCYYP